MTSTSARAKIALLILARILWPAPLLSFSLVLFCVLAIPETATAKNGILASNKLRLIVLTDINPHSVEPDDAESLIRLMLYSNQIDIEAIITTPSWVAQTVDESSYQRILTAVHAYGQVQSNLAVHASGYPTEDYLTNRVKHGTSSWSMTNVGAGKGNEGSNFIISIVDNTNDSRRVWVAAWTGLTTLAQALYDVQATRSPAEVEAFASRITVYDIDSQDDCSAWIMHNFPSVKYLCSDWQFWGVSTASDATGQIVGDPNSFSDIWVYENIRSCGPLGAAYPSRVYNYETDSPSFMYAIQNGLNDPDEQNWGGWGGRFSEYPVLNPPPQSFVYQDSAAYSPYYGYRDEADTYTYNGYTYTNSLFAGVARWKTAYQNEMAVRMTWSTNADYSGCNHSPKAVLNGDSTLNILTINANAGQSVNLSAMGSSDPDGDMLSYKWYVYPEPGTYNGAVGISNALSPEASVMVPNDATNDSIHIVLEVTDNGIGFPLTAYRRAIIRTGNGGVATGVMTTINDSDLGTNNNQFEYVGSWFPESGYHVGGNPGDYFNVRFSGTQIKLYGLITFSLGTAWARIDNGPPSLISFFGGSPEKDVLLYRSKILPAGAHILTVSATGDAYIAPDKAIVFSVASMPPNINYSASGGTLTLAWPADHLGWSLQAQTNSFGQSPGTNWHTLAGSEFVTTTNVPVASGNSPVFYRLKLAQQ